MASLTPPREPGRLTTTVVPIRPASPRESTAVGTPWRTPYARIASASPGISASRSGRVTSGVRSVGVRPVPPVVSTTRAPPTTSAETASPTGSPSGTTNGSAQVKPSEVRKATRRGPVAAAYTPAAARLEATTTAARMLIAGSSVEVSRLPTGLRQHAYVGDHRPLVDRLDHVDHGEPRDRDSGEGLHLDSGAVGGADGRGDLHRVIGDLEVDGHR